MKQMLHKTIVLRKCINCEGTIGIGVWPWSGQRFTVSHGLCRSCFHELEEAALADEPRSVRTRDPAEGERPADPAWYTAGGI